MTTEKNCIDSITEAFKGTFAEDDIKSLSDKISNVKKFAARNGEDAEAALNTLVKDQDDLHEQKTLAKKLRVIRSIEIQAKTMQNIMKWFDAGYEQSPFKALLSKFVGTQFRIEGARNNIDTRMHYARAKFNVDLQTFLHDEKLLTFYNSMANQLEISQKMMDEQEGISDIESPEGKIANYFTKQSKRLINGLESEGILTPRLKTRIFGTIHDSDKMQHIPWDVRRREKFSKEEANEYIFNEWKNFVRPKLDEQKTFIDQGVDPDIESQVDRYLRNVFFKLTNRDSPLTKKLNLSEKYEASRKLHWDGAQSANDYLEKYGNGTPAEAIANELGQGFATLELVKNFGAEPIDTLNAIYENLEKVKIGDKRPFKDRVEKGKELLKLQKVMSGLMSGTARKIPGALGTIVNAIKAWEIANHLGLVTLRSIPDLGSLGNEAKRLNMSQFESVGHALRILSQGLSDEEKAQLADTFDVWKRAHNGFINQQFPNEFGTASLTAKLMSLSSTVNGIAKWDFAMQSATQALLGRWFALNKEIAHSELSEKDRTNLEIYGINEVHYETIRKSAQTAVGAKKLIMPDSVQFMKNEDVRAIMKDHGETNLSDRAVNRFKNEVEDNMRTYFNDRMDHVVQRGDTIDRQMLSFLGDGKWSLAAGKLLTQFKMFGLSYLRKNLRETMFGNGARNWNEALWGGKANKQAMAMLTGKMMLYTYMGNTLANLAQGYEPPDLTNPNTYSNLMTDALGGIVGSVIKFDVTDPKKSAADFVFGAPFISEAGSLANVPASIVESTVGAKPWSQTQKAIWGVAHNIHPLIDGLASNWAWNYISGNNFYELAHGYGSLQKHYDTMSKYGQNKI